MIAPACVREFHVISALVIVSEHLTGTDPFLFPFFSSHFIDRVDPFSRVWAQHLTLSKLVMWQNPRSHWHELGMDLCKELQVTPPRASFCMRSCRPVEKPMTISAFPISRNPFFLVFLSQPLDEFARQKGTEAQSASVTHTLEGVAVHQTMNGQPDCTHIPSFVTILYVPLAWKLPSISPLASTWTLPRMSSGLFPLISLGLRFSPIPPRADCSPCYPSKIRRVSPLQAPS